MYLDKEEWRDIKGFEGLYQVSNLGRVMNHKGRIRIPRKDKSGYFYITLYNNGFKKTYKVHRLVAEAFIPNPNNYPVINHKDENKINNRVENLEWCTVQYNAEYSKAKSVNQYTKDGVFIRSWKSITKACEELKVDRKGVSRVCMGIKGYYTCGGYIWRYKT